jgi:hypothetical protein
MAQPQNKTDTPRVLDPEQTFESIVSWVAQQIEAENAPGVIIGISGTDSILTFLACARAFEKLGKPDRVLGVHYAHENAPVEADEIQCAGSNHDWVATQIMPWLQNQAPGAVLEIDNTLTENDDNKRWGALFSRAVRDTDNGQGLTSRFYFPVGSRNATEDFLGTYSQASKAVSMLPIVDLYKSEVLQLCEYLGVPEIALEKSREVDCDCGRFDVAAHHLEEVDSYIMWAQGMLSSTYFPTAMSRETLNNVTKYATLERLRNEFRNQTPYKPASSLVQVIGAPS